MPQRLPASARFGSRLPAGLRVENEQDILSEHETDYPFQNRGNRTEFSVSPDKRPSRTVRRERPHRDAVRLGPSIDDAHDIAFFRRHEEDDRLRSIPGRAFLKACPPAVARKFFAVLTQAIDVEKPLLVIVDGRSKPLGTTLPGRDYQAIRDLGREYLARNPRSLA
jgi:hypothetical protein